MKLKEELISVPLNEIRSMKLSFDNSNPKLFCEKTDGTVQEIPVTIEDRVLKIGERALPEEGYVCQM